MKSEITSPVRQIGDEPAALLQTRGFLRRHDELLLACLAILVFAALWELLPGLGLVNPLFTSSPSRILQAAVWLFQHGFWNDLGVSAEEFGLGMVAAFLVGIPGGILLGWYRRLNAMFDPFVQGINAMPRVALLPLLILWLGIGAESKIAVVFLGALFPILLNAAVGVRGMDPALVRCARAFGASDRQIFTSIALPGSLPLILTGVRLAIGRGLIGVVVGEMLVSTAGVGHMMSIASASFQTDKVFVGVIILAGFGVVFSGLLRRLENRLEPWRTNPRGEVL